MSETPSLSVEITLEFGVVVKGTTEQDRITFMSDAGKSREWLTIKQVGGNTSVKTSRIMAIRFLEPLSRTTEVPPQHWEAARG